LLRFQNVTSSAFLVNIQFCLGFTQEEFTWASYLKMAKFPAAPKHLFTNTHATVSIRYFVDSVSTLDARAVNLLFAECQF